MQYINQLNLKLEFSFIIFLGILAGILSVTFPETNGQEMMETIEEAERFYRGEIKKPSNISNNVTSYEIENM